MSLSDQTLWVKCEHGFQAVLADDNGPPVEDILGIDGVKAVRAKDFAPCKTCEHIEVCMESYWNDIRLGHVREEIVPHVGQDRLSMIHTCVCCDEKVLTISGEPKRVVPDGCPRWNPQSGCALSCGGCRQRREEIDKLHPKYQQKMDAVKAFTHLFQSAITEDEFTRKRNIRQVSGKFVTSLIPDFALYTDENVLFMAQEVWMEMLKAIKSTVPTFWSEEVAPNAPFQAHFTQTGLDYMYHSLLRHGGAVEKVAEELFLFLTDMGAFTRHWARFRVSEKKLIKRGWQGVIRRVWLFYEGQV